MVSEGVGFFSRVEMYSIRYIIRDRNRFNLLYIPLTKYEAITKATITHEQINVLDFDGDNCNDEIDYSMDQCIQDNILKVTI